MLPRLSLDRAPSGVGGAHLPCGLASAARGILPLAALCSVVQESSRNSREQGEGEGGILKSRKVVIGKWKSHNGYAGAPRGRAKLTGLKCESMSRYFRNRGIERGRSPPAKSVARRGRLSESFGRVTFGSRGALTARRDFVPTA